MRRRTQIYLVLAFLGLAGCFDPPEFPDEPVIEFANVTYRVVDGAADSLILSFRFEDGDGDIGLGADELFPPYHPFDAVIDSVNRIKIFNQDTSARAVTITEDSLALPLYTIDPFDEITLLAEEDIRPDYNCIDYSIFEQDTFYVVPNPFNKNIIIDILRKVNGQYVRINDELSGSTVCPEDFDARIPVFDSENFGRALSGTINYSLLSQGFDLVFRSDTIKLRFFIYDRSLNRSNTVESPDFVLSDIRS